MPSMSAFVKVVFPAPVPPTIRLCNLGYGVNGDRGAAVPSFRDWSGEVYSFPRDVA